jgi:hypothetical protein
MLSGVGADELIAIWVKAREVWKVGEGRGKMRGRASGRGGVGCADFMRKRGVRELCQHNSSPPLPNPTTNHPFLLQPPLPACSNSPNENLYSPSLPFAFPPLLTTFG